MSAAALLITLRQLDVKVSVKGDRLNVNVPKGSVQDELKALIKPYKEELIQLLSGDLEVQLAAIQQTLNSVGSDPWLNAKIKQTRTELKTPWLLPYQALIEAAGDGLLPLGPVEFDCPSGEHLVIRDPTEAVVSSAQGIALLAAMTRGRAITGCVKASLLGHFNTLAMIETWRCRLECSV